MLRSLPISNKDEQVEITKPSNELWHLVDTQSLS